MFEYTLFLETFYFDETNFNDQESVKKDYSTWISEITDLFEFLNLKTEAPEGKFILGDVHYPYL
jgi:hypothetical protein